MSDTWQKQSHNERFPAAEPYPGFAHTHQDYYEQHRRQQELLASTPAPQNLAPTIWQAMNPRWYPTIPGLPPEKAAELQATLREKRRRFYTMTAMFGASVAAAIFRFFT